MQISDGTKICIHIDYEMGVEEGLGHQAIVRNLTKVWSMKPNEIEAYYQRARRISIRSFQRSNSMSVNYTEEQVKHMVEAYQSEA